MAESWGNAAASKYDQDIVSDPANNNVLQVNTDTGDQGAGDDLVAVHAINKATGANARGLKVEGVSEFGGDVITDWDIGPVVKIEDVNIGDAGANKIALHTINSNTGANARALKASFRNPHRLSFLSRIPIPSTQLRQSSLYYLHQVICHCRYITH